MTRNRSIRGGKAISNEKDHFSYLIIKDEAFYPRLCYRDNHDSLFRIKNTDTEDKTSLPFIQESSQRADLEPP